MGTVDLPVNVPSVDEKNSVFARSGSFAFIQELERTWKSNRVEHVRSHGDHDIHTSILD
jgi:hypothetical protein